MARTQDAETARPHRDRSPRSEICQWAPSSHNGQTTRGVAVTEAGRLARLDFYQSIESRYYGPVAAGIRCASWEIGCEALGIRGHFAVLREADRGAGVLGPAPGYDVSWVADEPL